MHFLTGNSIMRAEMDGSNRVLLISVDSPRGIVIDFEGSRLYMTSTGEKQIRSSSLAGGDIRTIVQLGPASHSQVIAVMGERIYWTDHFAGKLESCKKYGTDVQGGPKVL